MKEFTYTITDPLGIHARPAGRLGNEIRKFSSRCTITKGDKTEKMPRIMALMQMGVKHGDTVTIRVEGEDEDAAIQALQAFFRENL